MTGALDAIDPMTVERKGGTGYPPSLAGIVDGRFKRRLGDVFGLTGFGVNLTDLEPGAASGHRHAHTKEDEFVYVVSGEVVLVTDNGETVMTPGMVAGYKAGNGLHHHIVNRSGKTATILEIGSRIEGDEATYSDVNLRCDWKDGVHVFLHKDGTPY